MKHKMLHFTTSRYFYENTSPDKTLSPNQEFAFAEMKE